MGREDLGSEIPFAAMLPITNLLWLLLKLLLLLLLLRGMRSVDMCYCYKYADWKQL